MLHTISLHCQNQSLRALLEAQLRAEGCIVTAHGEVNVLLDQPVGSASAMLTADGQRQTIVVTDNPCHEYWLNAMDSGVTGLIAGEYTVRNFLMAVQSVAAGQRFYQHPAVKSKLTASQRRILHLVAQGLESKTIAAQLGIEDQSVRKRISELLDTLRSSHPQLYLKSAKQLQLYYWGLWTALQIRSRLSPPRPPHKCRVYRCGWRNPHKNFRICSSLEPHHNLERTGGR